MTTLTNGPGISMLLNAHGDDELSVPGSRAPEEDRGSGRAAVAQFRRKIRHFDLYGKMVSRTQTPLPILA